MNHQTLTLSLLLLLFLFLCQTGFAASPPTGLVDGRLPPCPDKPNCVNSEDPNAQARVAPLNYAGDSAQAWENLRKAVAASGGVIAVEGDGYLRAVYTSQIWRFKDDVECRLDPAASVIQLRSASRIGYWDLGANRRRVEEIRQIFNKLEKGDNIRKE